MFVCCIVATVSWLFENELLKTHDEKEEIDSNSC